MVDAPPRGPVEPTDLLAPEETFQDPLCVWTLPVLHPAFLLRGNEQLVPTFTRDLERALRIAKSGWEDPVKVYVILPDTPRAEILEALEYLRKWASETVMVAVDVETTRGAGGRPDPTRVKLKTVALSQHGQDVTVALPATPDVIYPRRTELIRAVHDLLANEHVPKVFQNFRFDTIVLPRHGHPVRGPIFDDLVAHHVAEPDSAHDLGFVAQDLLDTHAWKEEFRDLERGKKEPPLAKLLLYNGLDAHRTQKLVDPLCDLLTSREVWPVFEAETRWTYLARSMEECGIPIHEPTRKAFEERLTTRRDDCLARIREACGVDYLNLNKPDHARWLLYEFLGLPVTRYTKKRLDPSTSYKALLDFIDNLVVQLYVKWIEAKSDLATFVVGFGKRVHEDGRMRPSWNTTGQVGSRWSSQPNAANVPPHLRPMIRPAEGRVLVYADFEQLEYRIIACLAGAERLLEIFRDPDGDAHTDMARYVFGADAFDALDKKRGKAVRTITKRVVYALGYGAEPPKITQSLREDRRLPIEIRALVTLATVTRIHQGFFKANPEIQPWRNGLVDFVNRHGYLEIPPLGRRRYFTLPAERNKVFNWPVQTMGSDIMNLALCEIHENLPAGALTLIHAHDAGVWECDEADAEEVCSLVEEKMRTIIEGPAGPVELTAKAEIHKNGWFENADWAA